MAGRTDLRRAGDFKQASGRLLANALLDLRRPPTARIGCNHWMTVGAPAAIHHRGLRGPQDMWGSWASMIGRGPRRWTRR